MILTERLEKRFGDKIAVVGLDLAVDAGEFFCFLGPNGAGKTTTIKMLTGLLRPTSGRALIGGFDIQNQPLQAKGLTGYIPDHPFLYDRLTGLEFLAFIAGLYRLPKARWQPLAEELLEVFELSAAAGSLIQGYSHGMRQKLSFASTFLHEPKLVVIDEPWVGLDPKNIHRVKHFLRQKVDQGLTVFMSTHSLSLAEELADRVGIIHQGRLLQIGRVTEIKALVERAESHGAPSSLEEAFLRLTRDDEQ